MTLLDAEIANLSTVELGRIAVMQKENQTHGAPRSPIAIAVLAELHTRALGEDRHRRNTETGYYSR